MGGMRTRCLSTQCDQRCSIVQNSESPVRLGVWSCSHLTMTELQGHRFGTDQGFCCDRPVNSWFRQLRQAIPADTNLWVNSQHPPPRGVEPVGSLGSLRCGLAQEIPLL